MNSDPLLEISELSVRFPKDDNPDVEAVDDMHIQLQSGSIHGLVGESGSGKSVTAKSVMRLLDTAVIEADTFAYRDENLLEKSEREMQTIRGGEIAMVFQDSLSALNPVISVGEQVAEVVRHHGNLDESTGLVSELRRKYITGTDKSAESWQRAIELLDTVGIPDPEQIATEYPHQLSGGQRQRVMIAQALAGNPSLIVADEPTTALDVTVEANILAELKHLAEEFNIAILLITHDLGVVAETCDKVTVMYSGSVMEQADTDQLFQNPQHPYTAGLLNSIPKSDDGESQELMTIPGSAPAPTERPRGCPFRDRCPVEFDACSEPIVERDITLTHSSYCHLHNGDRDSQELTSIWLSGETATTADSHTETVPVSSTPVEEDSNSR